MNSTPTLSDCLAPRFGQTINASWYNGVTFVFNLEWTHAQFAANNPNAFDIAGFGGLAAQCIRQGGIWICPQTLPPPHPEIFFFWVINVELTTFAGKLVVIVTFSCGFDRRFSGQTYVDALNDNINATQVSNVDIWMQYDTLCPVGTPTEIFRGNVGDSGAFDFTGASVSLVWA